MYLSWRIFLHAGKIFGKDSYHTYYTNNYAKGIIIMNYTIKNQNDRFVILVFYFTKCNSLYDLILFRTADNHLINLFHFLLSILNIQINKIWAVSESIFCHYFLGVGITIPTRDEQHLKASPPISVIPLGMVSYTEFKQPLNTEGDTCLKLLWQNNLFKTCASVKSTNIWVSPIKKFFWTYTNRF